MKIPNTTILLLAIAILLPAAPRAAEPAAYDPAKWKPNMEKFARQDREDPPPQGGVLFLGSSSIRFWKSLDTDFPGLPLRNRGFGGSRISDSTLYFDQLVLPMKPRLIVFFAGTNDINAGISAEQVAADFREFCAKLHSVLPDTRVIYISIAITERRWEQRATVALANTCIAAFCHSDPKRLLFFDTNSTLLTPEGKPRPELYRDDKLHMNAKGYAEWAKLLRPLLMPQQQPAS